MENLELRRLRSTDASGFRDIRLQALREHPEAFGASWEEEKVQSVSRFAERLENGHVIGALTNGERIVGTIGISRSKGQKTQHIGSIWGMYVRPEARGKGVARLLLKAAVAEMRTELRSLRLSVEANNRPAIRLYESAGFLRWALEKQALKVGEVFYDEILMRFDAL